MMTTMLRSIVPALVVALAACAPPIDDDSPDDDDDDDLPVFEPIEGGEFEVVEDRPATVFVPPSYDPTVPMPFVLLLHGYGVTGAQMIQFVDFANVSEDNEFMFASPSGNTDSGGAPFWNATNACCDFEQTGVDDSAYLRAIVDEARTIANIDPARIFVLGHSNGGFMALRLACDHSDVFSAVVSIAGAASSNEGCAASEGIAVLQVHGTADETVLYDGGQLAPGLGYPSAQQTVSTWVDRNACDPTAIDGGTIDIETIVGAETSIARYEGCEEGGAVELWTVEAGTHVPQGNASYMPPRLAFMNTPAR